MFRIDDATAATSLPTPETAGTEGYFTEGNPTAGTPATNVRGSWLNMIQEELCAILSAAGITRSKTTYNQVNSALQKMYSPVVGTVRNLVMTVTAASASATLTADQIVVASALNGQTYQLASFTKTINLATTGAGGMDTGTAPVSGYVALYAIYNPSTGASALLATNATAAVQPQIYGGANMPAGYTASALISVAPTNASSQIIALQQRDRKISIAQVTILNTSSVTAGATFSTTGFPKNAIRFGGNTTILNTAVSAMSMSVFDSEGTFAQQINNSNLTAGAQSTIPFRDSQISTPQQVRWSGSSGAGTPTFIMTVNSYEI
ncbi:hypothetical protein [Caballeronia sp. GAFFF3]|uniref:hypothetical protein n=1 Tax=Caballeronia sp. GAFFF3 TaxID=2921759 RepID=UPI0020279C88|nr:hypothetical protein [Caballeronia sp. GAFFF3]